MCIKHFTTYMCIKISQSTPLICAVVCINKIFWKRKEKTFSLSLTEACCALSCFINLLISFEHGTSLFIYSLVTSQSLLLSVSQKPFHVPLTLVHCDIIFFLVSTILLFHSTAPSLTSWTPVPWDVDSAVWAMCWVKKVLVRMSQIRKALSKWRT
jgi:hypothetical protein